LNQSLRNRDELKDDAISQLSDQLVALLTRLQEIERRQQLLVWYVIIAEYAIENITTFWPSLYELDCRKLKEGNSYWYDMLLLQNTP